MAFTMGYPAAPAKKSPIQQFIEDARLFGYDNRKDLRAKRNQEARELAEREHKIWQDYHKYLGTLHLKKERQRRQKSMTPWALLKRAIRFLKHGIQIEGNDHASLVAQMEWPETPEEWENDPLKAQACKTADGDEESDNKASKLQLHILAEANQHFEVPDPWFDEGTTYYEIRQYCLEKMQSQPLWNFYSFVILLNAATLGMEANGTIGPTESAIVESCFTLLYTYEIFVRVFGASTYPWFVPMVWLDGIIWIIAVVDLWLLNALHIFYDFPRPDLTALMVFRLLRLSKILIAIEKFTWVSRPLRVVVLACQTTAALLASIVFSYYTFIFFGSSLVVTVLRSSEIEEVPYFSKLAHATYAMTMVVLNAEDWVTVYGVALRDASWLAAAIFRIGAVLLMFLGLFIFAVLTEKVLNAAKVDDAKQTFRLIRDQMDFDVIEELLRRIDYKLDGYLDIDELNRAYFKHPFIAEVLGMTMDKAWQLLKELDQSCSGRVSINKYIVGLFRSRCARRDIESMFFEKQLKTCEAGVVHAYESAIDCSSSAKARTALEGDHILDMQHGLADEIDKMREVMLMNETATDLKIHNVNFILQDLDEQLESLAEIVQQTDFAAVEEVSEGSMRIAGMRLAGDIKNIIGEVEEWLRSSAGAYDTLEEFIVPVDVTVADIAALFQAMRQSRVEDALAIVSGL